MNIGCFGDKPLLSSVVLFHHPLEIAIVFFLLYGLAFVVEFLTLAKPDFHLYESVLKVDFERNERIALLLHFAAELVYLGAVEQKFASAASVHVVVTAHFVWRNMRAEHKDFAVFDNDETVSEIDLSKTHGLHFASHEDDTRFIGVLDEIVVICFFVGCNKFFHTKIIYYYRLIFKRKYPYIKQNGSKTSRCDIVSNH